MADVLQIVGALALVVAGFLVSLAAGFVVLGVMCLLAGVAQEAKVRRRGSAEPSS